MCYSFQHDDLFVICLSQICTLYVKSALCMCTVWLFRVLLPEWPDRRKVKQVDFYQHYVEHLEVQKTCQFSLKKPWFLCIWLKELVWYQDHLQLHHLVAAHNLTAAKCDESKSNNQCRCLFRGFIVYLSWMLSTSKIMMQKSLLAWFLSCSYEFWARTSTNGRRPSR